MCINVLCLCSLSQGQSVARQFGSLGKKLKKNLGKLARNSSFKSSSRAVHAIDNGHAANEEKRVVSPSQPFILSAFIHTSQHALPYQNEMIDNYLQVRTHASVRITREGDRNILTAKHRVPPRILCARVYVVCIVRTL